jgi:MFS family permease
MSGMPLFLLASMVSGFGGGAIFPLFAAMTANYFGKEQQRDQRPCHSSKVISGWSVPAWVRSWWTTGVTAPRSRSPVRSASPAPSSRCCCAPKLEAACAD